jgi:hypothetical protein
MYSPANRSATCQFQDTRPDASIRSMAVIGRSETFADG